MTGDDGNLVSDNVANYLNDIVGESPPPAPAMEQEAEERDFPIVGPQVGRFLAQISGMIRPGRIVELGSGFGYSAFWFGLGASRAEIHLTDYERSNIELAEEFLRQTDQPERYIYHQGDALESVNSINGPVECIFIDMKKTLYPQALRWAEERLAPGGILLADNVLWKGHVADGSEQDGDTEAIREFNNKLFESPWSASIIPIRDGVALAQKNGPVA